MKLSRIRNAFFVCMLLLSLGTIASAQPVSGGGLNADGRDFYLGLLYPSFNSQNINFFGRNVLGFYGVYALITTYDDNVVNVSYFDTLTGKETVVMTKKVPRRSSIQVPLSVANMKMDEPGEMVEWKSCHITAVKPINVQYFSTGSCSGGSYLALPTAVLGKTYVVESYHDNVGGVGGALSNEDASGYFMVIGAYDGTTVQIIPSSTTKTGRPGVNCGSGASGQPQGFTIGLNHGQCYMVKSAATDPSCNISGTTVIADKPVAVIGGHENAFTDGSDPAPGGARTLEARDYMVEQMIPVEQWDSTGLVSIPFVDSQLPANDGQGDEYDMFTGIIPALAQPGPKGSKANLDDGVVSLDMSTAPYASPIPQRIGEIFPVNAYSLNGTKIHIVQYDQRMQGNGPPYPAPSQMSIVPMSHWKNSYLWYVPQNTFEILQGYYINLLCYKSDWNGNRILLSYNGGKLNSIKGAGGGVGLVRTYSNIPGHPELIGATFSLGPGSYYATDTIIVTQVYDSTLKKKVPHYDVPNPFMIYNYGFRAIDPDRDLGDFCGDDHFFGYALPIGMTTHGDSGQITVTVDTLCSQWHIHIHDGRPLNGGISSIQLLNDPFGDILRPAQVLHNVAFPPALDPNGTNEIDLPGTDTAVDVTVLVPNPLDTAYGPVYILDNQGNGYLVTLRYKAPKLGDTATPPQYAVMGPGRPLLLDSVVFQPTAVCNDTACATVYFINYGKPNSDQGIQIDSVVLTNKHDSNFTLVNTIPAFDPKVGMTLSPGDTLRVNICFHPTDTTVHLDTLMLTTQCFKAPIPLVGPGGTPLLVATDKDFGPVVVGNSKCDTVTVRNVGNMPVTITSQMLHDNVNFTYNTSNIQLPLVLQPGGSKTFSFCFHPTAAGFDSTTNDWLNDIGCQFAGQIKPWSYLKGTGLKPGLIWDRQKQFDTTICDNPDTVVVYLRSTSPAQTYIRLVYFSGPDSAEYRVIDDKFHLSPLEQQYMNAYDSTFVVYVFTPDLTKTPKFADRHTQLIASYYTDASQTSTDSTVIDLTGTILYPALKIDPDTADFGILGVGQPGRAFTTMSDTGTAPYILTAANFVAPVDSLKDPAGHPLTVGDTIYPGELLNVELDGQLSQPGDTIVPLNFAGMYDCANSPIAYAHILASSTSLFATGWPSPDTYINCRQNKGRIIVSNSGHSDWTIDSVSLVGINGTGLSEFDLIDTSNNDAQTSVLVPKHLLKSSSTFTIPVIFHPIHMGPDSVQVRFVLDSANKRDTILLTFLTGNGIAVATTMSAVNTDPTSVVPGFYVKNTGDNLDIPVHFDVAALPLSADARRVKFDLTFTRDMFELIPTGQFTPGPGYQGTINAPVDNGDLTTVSVDVSHPSGPITSLDTVGILHFQAMTALDESSLFQITNIKYYDINGDSICYIVTDTVSGKFIVQSLCGDSTLRIWLNKQTPVKIVSLSPNPTDGTISPVLDYKVAENNTPVRIEVYNVLGQLVRTLKNNPSHDAGEFQFPVGTKDLESGTYSVRVSTMHSSQNAQFIIQR